MDAGHLSLTFQALSIVRLIKSCSMVGEKFWKWLKFKQSKHKKGPCKWLFFIWLQCTNNEVKNDGDKWMIKSILKSVLGLKCLSDSYHNMQIKIHHWSIQPLTLKVTISAK